MNVYINHSCALPFWAVLQIIVPLMWPFGSSNGMQTLQMPVTLPTEAQVCVEAACNVVSRSAPLLCRYVCQSVRSELFC